MAQGENFFNSLKFIDHGYLFRTLQNFTVFYGFLRQVDCLEFDSKRKGQTVYIDGQMIVYIHFIDNNRPIVSPYKFWLLQTVYIQCQMTLKIRFFCSV